MYRCTNVPMKNAFAHFNFIVEDIKKVEKVETVWTILTLSTFLTFSTFLKS